MFVFRLLLLFFFFNDTATTEIYTLSLHDALPISWSCAGQDRLVQRVIAPSRWTSAPQAGQWVGIRNSGSPSGGRASAMTRTISGITSPARRRKMRSPLRTSLRRTPPPLFSGARATLTPPTCPGGGEATGGSAP